MLFNLSLAVIHSSIHLFIIYGIYAGLSEFLVVFSTLSLSPSPSLSL